MNSLILPGSSCQGPWLSNCLGAIVAESTGISGGEHEGDEGVVSRANAAGIEHTPSSPGVGTMGLFQCVG